MLPPHAFTLTLNFMTTIADFVVASSLIMHYYSTIQYVVFYRYCTVHMHMVCKSVQHGIGILKYSPLQLTWRGSWVDVGVQVFAICAMRSIYTLVSNAISDLPYLKPAVALVLGFVGLKMLAEYFHYDVSTVLSLSVVRTTLPAVMMLRLRVGRETRNKKRCPADVFVSIRRLLSKYSSHFGDCCNRFKRKHA